MALGAQKVQTYKRELKNYLIIQTAFIGDVILALPIAQAIKKNVKECKVDFLCIPSTAELLKGNEFIDDIIIYDKKNKGNNLGEFFSILKIIRRNGYSGIISPHRFLRSTLLSYFSGVRDTVSYDISSLSFLYKHKIKYTNIHEIRRNLSLIKPLGINENNIIRPLLNPSENDILAVRKILKGLNIKNKNDLMCMSPGSVWFTKTFPKDKFVNLLNIMSGMQIKIALIGSESDNKTNKYIISNSHNNNAYNFAGKLTLLQTTELIKQSALLITNDSAPLHIANSVQTPVIAIFGATIPDFGFYPYGENDKIIEISGLHCRPCSIHGGSKCPVGTFDCMKEIDEMNIYKEINNILK